jgi:hypothetical protein
MKTILQIKSNTLSVLDLPAELRGMIDAYTVCPNTTPLTDFNGLYFSCRIIKQ